MGDARIVRVSFDGKPPAQVKLKLTFDAKEFLDWAKARKDRGVYNLSYTFTNTLVTTINNYTLKVLLPPGYVMNQVASSTPKATGEEVEPPYDFASTTGSTVVTLRSKTVGPGKTAAIAFGFKGVDGNPAPILLLGLVIAAAGVYIKRDLILRKGDEASS